MNHMDHTPELGNGFRIADYIPLIIIFCVIIAITCGLQWYRGFSFIGALSDFMAAFFLIFGFFKIINWPQFVQAYGEYDLLAQKSVAYAYAYPLIEIGLGILYLLRLFPVFTNVVTFIIMCISSLGVLVALRKKNNIVCACLGAVFKLPMTYVSLFEDLLMVTMALVMLIMGLAK